MTSPLGRPPAPSLQDDDHAIRDIRTAPVASVMIGDAMHDRLLAALRQSARFAGLDPDALEPLPTTGLAHDHVRVRGTGLLLRVPMQSQLALDPAGNLAYQAACFARASASGHAPRLHGVLAPSPDLPLGALIVDEIAGRPPVLPDDLPALARALAAIHALPLPPAAGRPPLKDHGDPVGETLDEVRRQAVHLDAAGPDPEALVQIREELAWAEGFAAAAREAGPVPTALISFDAHPGNFLIEPDGRAVLVDLEKARYGATGYDLAHATLYTSTTWDVAVYAELTPEQTAAFHDEWRTALPPAAAEAARPWLLPLRRIMWLWSVTWCAKWRVQSQAAARARTGETVSAEDWSAELSRPELVAHVRGRVADYLDPETISRVRADWCGDHALTDLLSRPWA